MYRILLLSLLLFVLDTHYCLAQEKVKQDIKTTKVISYYPNGMARKIVNTYYSIEDKVDIKRTITEYNEYGQFIRTKTEYLNDNLARWQKRKDYQKHVENSPEYEFRVLKKDIKIKKVETEEDDTSTISHDAVHDDRIATQNGYTDPVTGKKKYKYKGAVEFLDDANISAPNFISDRDFMDHKKTYRYRFSTYNFDLKVQNWKPGAEYWLNPSKSKSIDIVYDRNLGVGMGGAWMLRYRKKF